MTETRSRKFPRFSRCLLRYCLVIKGFSLWEWCSRVERGEPLRSTGLSDSAEIMEHHSWNLELCSKSSREWIEAITWREREDCYQDYRDS